MSTRWISVAIYLFAVWPALAHSQTPLNVAVASNFIHTSQLLKNEFLKHTSTQIQFTYASSAKLYAQILHGAPYQIFLSADTDKVVKLIKQNKTLNTNYHIYATGRLALWQPQKRTGQCQVLIMANPKLAPYGLAAEQTIKKGQFKLPDCRQTIYAQNISQSWHYAASGHADAAFVALSQLVSKKVPAPEYQLVPADNHQAIAQAMVLLPAAEKHLYAKDFYQFLQSDKAKAIIQQAGYQ
ncbi:molybdate ABC transporter substrate-binding protein [Gayadomonas joobiniege]|uniref:molybdate ABC transporter substrate-binding protein n=1 Tax=Gayadomonas joobiniege TaxID=1234606 RepID=UPI000AE98EBB|nr:molybdate ABC transporter substrate-binding protein [Gayadomonas joobiniege]